MSRTNTSWRPTTTFVRRKEFKKHIATENPEGTENMDVFLIWVAITVNYYEIITREKMN
jgi:hypothetical protein